MSILDPSQLAFLPMRNKSAIEDWAQDHFYWHNSVQAEAVKQGQLDIGTYNVADMGDMNDWLYYHNDEHQKIAAAFNIESPPDLSFWDPDDQTNWDNWLMTHSLVHDAERKTLNL